MALLYAVRPQSPRCFVAIVPCFGVIVAIVDGFVCMAAFSRATKVAVELAYNG